MLAGRFKARSAIRALSAVAAVILAAGIASAALDRPASQSSASSVLMRHVEASLSASPRRFLSMYMDPDGRIVRRDQGGDTVSEGQAYAMLIAAASGDRTDFDRIWSWTKSHLSRADGLLAWHWQDGRVLDQMPASDADIDAAWALAVAASNFASPALAGDARRIASSVLAEETQPTAVGPVLVAGPWAVPSQIVEPGYLSPEAFSALGKVTADRSWSRIEATARHVLGSVVSGRRLPPEWMSVSTNGVVDPIGSPSDAGGTARYQLGAARVAPWWSASCSQPDRGVAAAEWPVLATTARSGAFDVSLSLSGQPQTTAMNPTAAVADAAAAAAAGQRTEAASLLASAEDLDRRFPTYYGAAWVALGYLLSFTSTLDNCRTL